MKLSCVNRMRRQAGATAVEFALISIFFFTLLLGIVELGRLMYVWNTVQEVTRRAAREAVVRDFDLTTDVPALRRQAIFRTGSVGTVTLPAAVEISDAEVRITYLDVNLAEISSLPDDPADNLSACEDVARVNSCIRYVRAEVCVVSNNACTGEIFYQPLVGFLFEVAGADFRIGIPVSPVVMPAEGLGFVPS